MVPGSNADPIGSKASASPSFKFLAHRPTESPVVMKDGSSKRFRSEDFSPPGSDDGGMDHSDQIPPMPEQRWRLKGPMQLVDLDNGFFIVRFVLEEDLLYVLTGGPWVVAGQYVAVQK
ncbi:hypothetical protein L3X38_003317 [Prunus dulcis]|uniref:DUF4283 domain-containing protein n=1 Tax=Prunus dulcis TaxID=3755 RepID=A0AAD4ZLU0_PRUDU|nr:hypothetical protein L3X38_003317 [Prunus dulcis]